MTTCPSCGGQTPAGGRFCIECGAAQAPACPGCGTAFQPGQRFCASCGAALTIGAAGSRPQAGPPAAVGPLAPTLTAAPVAERRVVSVVFADLVGFTPFAAERDAEDVRETLSRYFELASEVITRYGGTVEKFIGDAVMAVWGAPTTQEDDAERAVRAALDLVDAVQTLGPTIQARAAVLTGEAAVTLGAVNQGMVAGDLVNTAARLQGVAQSGSVLVGESTMRATTSAIAYEPAGPQALKGKEAPVAAWRALRVVAQVGGRNRAEGLEAPFVGRDDEMRQLKDLFHATARDRRVRLVSVIGPAGIGKSRLAWEFVKYIDGLVDTVWWHEGRAPAHGTGLAFWSLGEMVRGRCGLLESDDETATRAGVAAALALHVPDAAERRWIEPALLALLGIGERGAAPEQLFAAWRTFFERLAQTAPVVMLFEDLQWADPGTLDFIDHMLEWTRDVPIAVITLARPELVERRPDWGAKTRHFVRLFLEPLPEPAMRALLAGLVPGLPQRAVAAIVARADGVPLYAVETVRALLADGLLRLTDRGYEPVGDLSELAVPDSLTALIASRLDALDPIDRSLLQDAAVLGQTFSLPALASLSGMAVRDLEPRLPALVRREILSLQADPRSPERGQFSFVQALIREVAYNTLAKRDRRAKHLAAARWFESLGSDELAGALARHYLAAWQNAPDGPEADTLAGQARLALRAAADRARALYANEQVIELLHESLTVTVDAAERAAALIGIAQTSNVVGAYQEAERLAREALAILGPLGDRASRAAAATVVVRSRHAQLRERDHGALAEEFADLLEIVDEPNALTLRVMLARLIPGGPELELAERLLEPAVAGAERLGDRGLIYEALLTLASVVADRGHVVHALILYDGVARGAEAVGRPDLADRARSNVAVWSIDDDPMAALQAYRQAMDYERRTGDRRALTTSVANLAEISVGSGDWDLAVAEIRDLEGDDVEPADRMLLIEQLTVIALLRGEPEGASLLAEARAMAAENDGLANLLDDRAAVAAWVRGDMAEAIAHWRQYAAWSLLNAPAALPRSARAALWVGDVESARQDLEATVATGIHGAALEAQRDGIRAGIAALEGRTAEARTLFRQVLERWRALRQTWFEALTCMDIVLLLGPDDPDAPAAAGRAREVLEQLRARPFLDRLDAALSGTGHTAGPSATTRVGPAAPKVRSR